MPLYILQNDGTVPNRCKRILELNGSITLPNFLKFQYLTKIFSHILYYFENKMIPYITKQNSRRGNLGNIISIPRKLSLFNSVNKGFF